MGFSYKRLCEVQYLSNSAGALVTNPTGKKSYVRLIILHNTHTSALSVTLNMVPNSGGSAGTASAANQFFKQTLAADETQLIELATPGLVMEDTNDTVQGLAGTTNKVTFQAYGGQE